LVLVIKAQQAPVVNAPQEAQQVNLTLIPVTIVTVVAQAGLAELEAVPAVAVAVAAQQCCCSMIP
jgi:hypothetical protein